MISTLYIVPTPIGNYADITYRALSVLSSVDLIAAEDTRRTIKLLNYFKINASSRLLSFYDHNENEKTTLILRKLQQGKNIALVSDAGTPLINDPGYHLVKKCHENGIRLVPLPGACAAITALSVSGLSTDRFCYEGFLPIKRKKRIFRLNMLAQEQRTLILYESKHRLIDSIKDMASILGQERYIVIARELTKTWESIHSGTLREILHWIQEDPVHRKGEITLIVEGASKIKESHSLQPKVFQTLELLMSELPTSKSISLVAHIYKIKKTILYRYMMDHQKNSNFV